MDTSRTGNRQFSSPRVTDIERVREAFARALACAAPALMVSASVQVHS